MSVMFSELYVSYFVFLFFAICKERYFLCLPFSIIMLKAVCMEHNNFELAFDDHNALMHKKRLRNCTIKTYQYNSTFYLPVNFSLEMITRFRK